MISILDRKKLGTSVSTTTFTETMGISEEPRKKLLKQVDEGKIGTRDVRDVVRKVKEFPEPEQQMEILNEFERKEQWVKEAFDEIIEQKREIAEGKRHPEVIIKENKYEAFVEQMQYDFEKITGYGVANIASLPKVHKDKAIAILVNAIGYLLQELQKVDKQKFESLGRKF